MLDCKTTLTGLVTMGVLSLASSVEAYSLYPTNTNSCNHNQSLACWTSPFKGKVKLTTSLANGTDLANFQDFTVFKDNKDIHSVSNGSDDPLSSSQVEISRTIEVDIGTTIKLFANPIDASKSLDLNTDITIPSGLVFLGTDERKLAHVGLFVEEENKIYESSRSYVEGKYWDSLEGGYKNIDPSVIGVQDQHNLGTFLHLSNDENSSLVIQKEHVDPVAKGHADEAELDDVIEYIGYELGAHYASVPLGRTFLFPGEQKGEYGAYTGVGLIEGAAESVGIRNYQGFIDNHREFVLTNSTIIGGAVKDIPWECLEVFPRTAACDKIISDLGLDSNIKYPLISPGLLHYVLTKNPDPDGDILQGYFENMDFLLTTPDNKRLGYTPDGFVNELDPQSHFYEKDETSKRFTIENILDGAYRIELFGLCNEGALAVYGNDDQGSLISGCKDKPDDDRGDGSGDDDSGDDDSGGTDDSGDTDGSVTDDSGDDGSGETDGSGDDDSGDTDDSGDDGYGDDGSVTDDSGDDGSGDGDSGDTDSSEDDDSGNADGSGDNDSGSTDNSGTDDSVETDDSDHASVPEPSTVVALLMLGLGAMWRKKK